MSRIDDIKERHKAGYVTSFATPLEVIANYNADVLFLLSRIEIAEKALENIDDMIGEEFAEKTKERCQEAIQQIRA